MQDITDNSTSYLWNCLGANGGTNRNCSLAKPINGTCGTTNNSCTAGTLQDVADTTTNYLWNCLGVNGGTTRNCSIAKPINGTCGTTNNSCTAGTLQDIADNSTNYLWNCLGISGGTTSNCSIPLTPPPSPWPNSFEIIDQGMWINARNQGSYYAGHDNHFRDDSGRIHMTYCSSGEVFNPAVAPDWRPQTKFSSDSVRYQYSDDNGKSWSASSVIISASSKEPFWEYHPKWKVVRNWVDNGFWEYSTDHQAWIFYQKSPNSNYGSGWRSINRKQQDVFQGPCSNTMVYFQNKYYLYFESYTFPTGLISIFVARANQPQGPYEIYTMDGWKSSPTVSQWRPVLTSNILSFPNIADFIMNNYSDAGNGNPKSSLYGAGLPRSAVVKDGKIHLSYIDTTYWFLWSDAQGNIHSYNRSPSEQIPYTMIAVSDNPVSFNNSYDQRVRDQAGQELWTPIIPKYFPEQQMFYNFYIKNESSQNKIIYRTSADAKIWGEERFLGNILPGIKITNAPNMGDSIIEAGPHLVPQSDKYGHASIDDLYLTYAKEYLLPGGPVAWVDTPSYRWYYGGTDLYAIKAIPLN